MTHAVNVQNYSQTFGTRTVVHDLSFDVRQGEIFAFLGANGSGKTTTIRALLNLIPASKGELQIFDKHYASSDAGLLGYMPEERGLYVSATVRDTMLYFGELKGLSATQINQWTEEYLARVGLADKINARIKELSSGQQQKIQIGITIINQPKLLILDEPTKGLDPVNRELLMQILLDLNKKGSTVVFITHQMEEVEEIADRLVMIKNGRRVLYGNVQEVRESFGKNTIYVNFKGQLPHNDHLFDAKIATNTAELTPLHGISTQEIFKFLAQNNAQIQKFEIAAPSLQEIFVEVSNDKTK